MIQQKYTATVYYNDQALDHNSSDNYIQLMTSLLNQIESSCTSTYGTIKDNNQGKIIHRCRKTCIE
ncbi:MAG: hypothetical protein P1U63_06325 [Coxiellaceae bacterium]|nr:hypothetical protein [Coxiellaceae bacterium]